jgi:hypothetical protein
VHMWVLERILLNVGDQFGIMYFQCTRLQCPDVLRHKADGSTQHSLEISRPSIFVETHMFIMALYS